MHVNVAFRGMNGRALVRLARRFPRGETRRRAMIPSDALPRCNFTFEVVLMEGHRKDGTAAGRAEGESFSVSGSVDRIETVLDRDESDRRRMIRGARREGRPRGFTSAYFRAGSSYTHLSCSRRSCRETRNEGVYARASLRWGETVRRNISE